MQCFGILFGIAVLIIMYIIGKIFLPASLSGILQTIVGLGVGAVVLDYYFGEAIFGKHLICSAY